MKRTNRRLEALIREMVAAIQPQRGERDEFPSLHGEVVDLSRIVLKREWDRVNQPILVTGNKD